MVGFASQSIMIAESRPAPHEVQSIAAIRSQV